MRTRIGPRASDGVWDFARGCMRTYLILKDKARRFREDAEIQALLTEIRGEAADIVIGPYSRQHAMRLKDHSFRQRGARRAAPAV